MNDRMPALYIGHGAPPLLDDPLWSSQLAGLAADLPRPKAILIVSAHWESAPVMLSADGAPLVYDFGGFAEKYYRMTYATPPATALAQRVAAMMPDTEPVHQHPSRGLDHGAWVPLKIMYPDGDIPVLQMSLPTSDPHPAARARRAPAAAARRGRADHRLRLPHPRPAVPHRVPHRRRRARLVAGLRRLGRRGAGPRRRRRARVVPGRRRRACPTPTRPSSTTRRSSSPSVPPPTPRQPGEQLFEGFWMGLSKRSLQVA